MIENYKNSFILILLGLTKLLVGLGQVENGASSRIEIIDLESPSMTCKNLENFPYADIGSLGWLDSEDKPTICGGFEENECYYFKENQWISTFPLTTTRYNAAMSPSPYPAKYRQPFVTGGEISSSLRSVEVQTDHGWETFQPSLPVGMTLHCTTLVNSTTLLAIGGYGNGSYLSTTFFFNSETEIWTEGPRLNRTRGSHSCGRIRKDSQSQDFSVIVAGGFLTSGYTASVEILDEGSNEWRNGPSLPHEIVGAKIVEDQNGGIFLVGGYSYQYAYLDTLYSLAHVGSDVQWVKMEQRLKTRRNYLVAFLVPDDIVDCE